MTNEQKAGLQKAAGISGKKDECQMQLKSREQDYGMGREIGMFEGYGSQGNVTLSDSQREYHFLQTGGRGPILQYPLSSHPRIYSPLFSRIATTLRPMCVGP